MLVIMFATVIVIIVHVYILGDDPGQLGILYHYPSAPKVWPLVPALSFRSHGMSLPCYALTSVSNLTWMMDNLDTAVFNKYKNIESVVVCVYYYEVKIRFYWLQHFFLHYQAWRDRKLQQHKWAILHHQHMCCLDTKTSVLTHISATHVMSGYRDICVDT